MAIWVYINNAGGVVYGEGEFPSQLGGTPAWFSTWEEANTYIDAYWERRGVQDVQEEEMQKLTPEMYGVDDIDITEYSYAVMHYGQWVFFKTRKERAEYIARFNNTGTCKYVCW